MEAGFVFGLIAVAAIAMASGRIRFDIVALFVIVALIASGTLTVRQGLAGFGNPVVIVVAGLLVLGEMLVRTGVAQLVGDKILERGGSSETRLLILIMVAAGLLGSMMSSTAVVAIFIPIVIRIAGETGNNVSRMLLPTAYAALVSGMMTLIATSPNIVVHEELKAYGYEGFGFFSFTVVGLAILVVVISYMLLVGRRMLGSDAPLSGSANPMRAMEELWNDYRGAREHRRFMIDPGSLLVGESLSDADLGERYGVKVVSVASLENHDGQFTLADDDLVLSAGDILLAVGPPELLDRLEQEQGLNAMPASPRDRQRFLWDIGGAVALIHPESELIGKSISEVDFRASFGVEILGLRQGGEAVDDYEHTKLRVADSIFAFGPWSAIRRLQSHSHDFVMLELPAESGQIVPSYRKMPLALAIFALMVLLTVFDVVPLAVSVLIAVLAAVLTRCLTMEDAYRSIHWSAIVLIAGMLPLADALQVTGGTDLIVTSLMSFAGDAGPLFMLTVVFFLTAALGLFLSNTASAVLAAPIAITAAQVLGVSPYPFALAVVIAASCAYSTPVSSPVVTLVVEPGRYRFTDFVKVGVPLLFLSYVVTAILAPLIFPFHVS